jgi:hypothetical protein
MCFCCSSTTLQLRFQAPHSGQFEVLGLKALQPHQAHPLRSVLVEHACFNSRFAALKSNAEFRIGLDDAFPTGIMLRTLIPAAKEP